jgi:hypothetical protein
MRFASTPERTAGAGAATVSIALLDMASDAASVVQIVRFLSATSQLSASGGCFPASTSALLAAFHR